jgi:hypothetical protein
MVRDVYPAGVPGTLTTRRNRVGGYRPGGPGRRPQATTFAGPWNQRDGSSSAARPASTTARPEALRQPPGPFAVDPGGLHPPHEGLPRIPVRAVRRRRDREDVVLLEQQDAARAKGGGEAPQHLLARGDVDEHQAGVDEIELALGQLVGDEVHLADLETGRRGLPQQAHVEVRRDHAAGRADPPREPAGEGPVAGARVEAAPALADAERLRAPDARRVVAGLEQGQPVAGLLPCVRQRVPLLPDAARPAQGVLPSSWRRCPGVDDECPGLLPAMRRF